MYQIIADAKKNIQTAEINGTIGGVAFDGHNIDRNSVKITNQCCDTSTFNYGGVYIGQLDIKFIKNTMGILRNDWVGLEIVPIITIGEIEVPIGVYVVNSASYSGNMVTVKAYDRMSNFDKAAAVSENMNGTPFDWLNLACMECGVQLGMTRPEIELLPNGNLNLVLGILGDIQTWRDILYWLAVTMGCFVTMDREGHLVIRKYGTEPVDSLPATIRFSSSSYGDEIVRYTGINVVIQAEQIVEYYNNEPDTEYSLNIGTNPFMQGTKAQRQVYMDNLLTVLPDIDYVPCAVSIPFGFHYDLGDVLSCPGGYGSATNKFCVMYYSFSLNGACQFKSIPTPTKAMSKEEKDIQGLISNSNANEYQDYEQKNTKVIEIGDGEEKRIASVRLASNNATKAMIHLEVDLETMASTIADVVDVTVTEDQGDYSGEASGDDIFRLVSSSETQGVFRYLINGVEAPLKPTEQWTDGKHITHLMYILPLEQGVASQFDVYLKAQGGDIEIPMGGAWFYGSGRGLVGDGRWDGLIEIEEAASEWNMVEISFSNAGDNVSIAMDAPVSIAITDPASEWAMVEINYANAGESVDINMYVVKFSIIAENSDRIISEDGMYLVTENSEGGS